MLDFCLVNCFSPPLPSPLEVWGEPWGAEVLQQLCLPYISCPRDMCTQEPVNAQAFWTLPKPKEQCQALTYKLRLSCSHPPRRVTDLPAVGLYTLLWAPGRGGYLVVGPSGSPQGESAVSPGVQSTAMA